MIDLREMSDEERLLRRAADDALVGHAAMIIKNWMLDGEAQPERAFAGIRKSIIVWQDAIKAIESGEI